MTISEYVNDVLCVPVTRIGNRYIVEAIELVVDTHEHKFYQKLSQILNVTPQYLEKAIRDAKILGLSYMDALERQRIFNKDKITTSEYVVRAAEHYRRMYEKQES